MFPPPPRNAFLSLKGQWNQAESLQPSRMAPHCLGEEVNTWAWHSAHSPVWPGLPSSHFGSRGSRPRANTSSPNHSCSHPLSWEEASSAPMPCACSHHPSGSPQLSHAGQSSSIPRGCKLPIHFHHGDLQAPRFWLLLPSLRIQAATPLPATARVSAPGHCHGDCSEVLNRQ